MAGVSVLSLRQERERGEGAALVGVEARKEGEKKRDQNDLPGVRKEGKAVGAWREVSSEKTTTRPGTRRAGCRRDASVGVLTKWGLAVDALSVEGWKTRECQKQHSEAL